MTSPADPAVTATAKMSAFQNVVQLDRVSGSGIVNRKMLDPG